MSKFRYEVNFETAPLMQSDEGRTTLTETVYCDSIDVRIHNGVPMTVDFLDEDRDIVFAVHYEKFVSAERVSGNDNNDE